MSTGNDEVGILLRAMAFAAEKHRNQRRKDAESTPYINHPIAVATVLSEEGRVQDITVLLAALLHDTIEDTETTDTELRGRFGDKVASIVLEVTDDKTLPKADRKLLQIAHAVTASPGAKLVKIADKICNLRDIQATPPANWSTERRQEYFDWAWKVVQGCRGLNANLEAAFDQAMGYRP